MVDLRNHGCESEDSLRIIIHDFVKAKVTSINIDT